MIAALERIGTRIWAFHFRLPSLVWWLMGLTLAALALFAPKFEVSMAAAVLALFTLAGGIRWIWARRRCRGGLIVMLFYEGGEAVGRAEEAQRIVVDTLRSHLPLQLRNVVQPLALTLGPDEQELAEKTRRRLRGLFVLHGRVAARADGGWSVFPRILEPAYDSTTHLDWFTRDRTPANPRFGPFVTSLAPQIGVLDEEFPLEFCRDLEALIRGIVGRVAVMFGADEQAIGPLEEALEIAGESENAQIDALRLAKARAMARLGEMDAAINFLQARIERGNPAPELLRGYAHLLMERANKMAAIGEEPDPRDREKQIRALRQARAAVSDPLRDQSTYNLFAILDWSQDDAERKERAELLEELLHSKSRYGKQWYVRRAAGVMAWRKVEEARTEGDEEAARAAGKEAGRWYSRALRARPKLQIRRLGRRPWRWVRRVPPSPILFANAVDGHRVGGNKARAWWCERRFQRIRKRFWKKAWRATESEKWAEASAFYDWIAIVGRKDETEVFATTYAAICRWKYGQQAEGEHDWEQAFERHGPLALLARSNLVSFFEKWDVDPSVPGSEPTSQEDVEKEVQRMLAELP